MGSKDKRRLFKALVNPFSTDRGGGFDTVSLTVDATTALFSAIDQDGPVEAAFLIKRTGVVLASWISNKASQEVLSVMAATLMGSIETMIEALGCPSPRTVTVEAEEYRILATKVENQAILVIITPKTTGEALLRHTARQVSLQLAATPSNSRRAEVVARL